MSSMFKTKEQYVSQDEIGQIIISNMVKKRNSIVPVIGEDTLKENEKKLFVLGCNLPNRLFRFLWQPIQTKDNGDLKTKQDYWINKEKPEDSFENFLKKKNFLAYK